MTLILGNAYLRTATNSVFFAGELGLGEKGVRIAGTNQYEKDRITEWRPFTTEDFSIPADENGSVLDLEPFRQQLRTQYAALAKKRDKVYTSPEGLRTWFSTETPIRIQLPVGSCTIKVCMTEVIDDTGELVNTLKLLVSYHASTRTPLSGAPATSF